MYIIIEVIVMINKDNSFATNFKPNLDNAQIALEYLKQHNGRFQYNYLNHTIYKLWDLINEPQARAWLEPPAHNKTYPDLLERYIQVNMIHVVINVRYEIYYYRTLQPLS